MIWLYGSSTETKSSTEYNKLSLIRGGASLPKIQNIMSKKSIFNEFLRQTTDLMKYMNAYSLTLREFMSEDDFSELYERLTEIDSKYETYPE